MFGSTIEATGDLDLGSASSTVDLFSSGELIVDTHTATIHNQNIAVLGSLTDLGSKSDGVTLVAFNGLLIEQGDQRFPGKRFGWHACPPVTSDRRGARPTGGVSDARTLGRMARGKSAESHPTTQISYRSWVLQTRSKTTVTPTRCCRSSSASRRLANSKLCIYSGVCGACTSMTAGRPASRASRNAGSN